MSIFLNSQYHYDILTMDNGNIYLPCFRNMQETLDLWRHLGQSIIEIYFDNNIRPALYKMLFEMPQIEVIIFRNGLEEAADDLFMIYDEEPDKKLLPSLKKLVAKTALIEQSKKMLKSVAKLRKIIPKSAEIIVETVTGSISVPFDDILSMTQNVKVNAMEILVIDYPNDISKKLLVEDSLPFQGMTFLFPADSEPKFNFMHEFLNKHTNIKDVELECKYAPIPSAFTQITKLHLKGPQGHEPLRSLKVLEPLVNLKSLKISFGDTPQCVIGHEIVNLKKLQKLSMLETLIRCPACVTALANSFPYLSQFHGSIVVQEYPSIMGMMFNNWPYLTVMRLRCGTNLENLGKSVENFVDEQRLYLRILEITSTGVTRHRGDDFLQISKIFPHLSTLSIDLDETTGDLGDVVKGIIPAFKELTSLRIAARRSWIPIKTDMSNNILEYLEKNGHSLRVRTFDLLQNSGFLVHCLVLCRCLTFLYWM